MKNFIVSKILHKINRQRLFKRLADVWPKESFENSCILLKGGSENNRYATDTQFSPFRQESYFQWLFGVTVPSFYGMLLLQEEKSILFTDKKDPSYEVWQGKIKTIEEIKLEHFVDDVYYNEQIKEIINKNNVTKIFILNEKQLPNMFFTKDQVQALTGYN
ncbi:hypothetical protein A3Q56_05760 [Intoshia linei]|uniref:Aminopeptidase P N-terminal domain-containing protein n=1 Tax=Intoshia linei TaxID=1819745 RepID=A0A177AYR1_9BILA|nr:hypothetical protein A3Q56_05760 [Intoshia linei]